MDTQESPAVVIFEGEELSLRIVVYRYEFETYKYIEDANWLVARASVFIESQEFGYRIFLMPKDFARLLENASQLISSETKQVWFYPMEEQLEFRIEPGYDGNYTVEGEIRHDCVLADLRFGFVITADKLRGALDQVEVLLQRFPERKGGK